MTAIPRFIFLLAAAGVAAGAVPAERWIGFEPQQRYDISEREPGRFISTPSPMFTAQDTLGYDDGTPAVAWAWPDTGSGPAVKFIVPGDSAFLAGALVYFYGTQWPIPGGNSAALRVFAADGPGGAPGTLLWSDESLTVIRGAWNFVPVGESLPGGAFYLCYIQAGIYPYCPAVCTDAEENAGAGRRWEYTPGAGFAPDEQRGDWLMRPVLDWAPQAINATAAYFWTAPPRDTDPGINIPVRLAVRSLGDSALPARTPVRLRITGPNGYVFEADTVLDAGLARGEVRAVRLPDWAVPETAGDYSATAWVEAEGEQWPADDTLYWQTGVSQWVGYADFSPPRYWLHWVKERAVRFSPPDFGLVYPVGLTRLRAVFALNGPAWRDSSFRFRIYAEDGATVLFESDTLEAVPGQPGPPVVCDLDSTVVIGSGDFWVSVRAIDTSGLPGSVADDSAQGHSFYKDSFDWQQLDVGEYLVSASVQGEVGVAEPPQRAMAGRARLSVSPNPARARATVAWALDAALPGRVVLVDCAGRVARELWRGRARNGELDVDLRGLAAGCWFLRVETGAGSTSRALVVTR